MLTWRTMSSMFGFDAMLERTSRDSHTLYFENHLLSHFLSSWTLNVFSGKQQVWQLFWAAHSGSDLLGSLLVPCLLRLSVVCCRVFSDIRADGRNPSVSQYGVSSIPTGAGFGPQ